MVDGSTNYPPESPIEQDGVKDDTVQNTICNHRIEHTTKATVVNKRVTTKCTLDI